MTDFTAPASYYSGKQGPVHLDRPTEYRRLVREALANGWVQVFKPMTWEHERLLHEDGTYLHLRTDDRGFLTDAFMHRGGRGIRLTATEARKALREGARCTCTETVVLFDGEDPVLLPSDGCPFAHADIRADVGISRRHGRLAEVRA